MFEYLAAGKAVIGSVSGESAQILREAGAVVVPPEDHVALADAIRGLAAIRRADWRWAGPVDATWSSITTGWSWPGSTGRFSIRAGGRP